MPDITYPNTISASTATDAAALAENIFKPKYLPDNLEVINRLDENNFADSPPITRQMVRPGQYAVGGTSGHTANRDYFKQAYPGGWSVDNMAKAAKAAVPVAGIARTQFIPFVPTIFHVSWQFSLIVDDGQQYDELADYGKFWGYTGATSGQKTSLHLYINGVRIDNANFFAAHSQRTLAEWDSTLSVSSAVTAKAFRQDSRYFYGHLQIDAQNVSNYADFDATNTPLRKGDHTAEIRLASKKRLARFKTSNISILGMR